jgi:hypothetical protein
MFWLFEPLFPCTVAYKHLLTERKGRQRDRETERQRDRETERQRDRETERQRDRETEREKDRETKRRRDKETERQKDKEFQSLTLHCSNLDISIFRMVKINEWIA